MTFREHARATGNFMWMLVVGLSLLGGAARVRADTMLFQDNFDGNAPGMFPAGWGVSASGGNINAAVTFSGDNFNPGQYAGHGVYIEAAINNPFFTGTQMPGGVVFDHILNGSLVAGTTYDLAVDVGWSFSSELPNVNYGLQLWSGVPAGAGSTPLWEMAANSANQIMAPPSLGNWTTWTGSYIATSSTSIPLFVRLFSIDAGGDALPDIVNFDNVSVSIASTPLPSSLGGGLTLFAGLALQQVFRRRHSLADR